MRAIGRIAIAGAMMVAVAAPVGPDAVGAARAGGTAAPSSRPRAIGPGDPLRKTLLASLRPAIEKDLGQPVKFLVTALDVQDGWAFAVVTPRRRDGRAIDFRRTRYAAQQRDGLLDGDTVYAALHREKGRWTLKTFVIGPTDVAYADWPERFGVPARLLGMTGDE